MDVPARNDSKQVDRDESAGPDDSAKPDSLGDLRRESWTYVARRTVREFSKDQCTDLAAALVYYSVLAIFPAAIALPGSWLLPGCCSRSSGWSARPTRRSRP